MSVESEAAGVAAADPDEGDPVAGGFAAASPVAAGAAVGAPVAAGCAAGVAGAFAPVAGFAASGAPVAGVSAGVAALPPAGAAPSGFADGEAPASEADGVAGFDAEDEEDEDAFGFADDISPENPWPLQRKYPRPTASANASSINIYFHAPLP